MAQEQRRVERVALTREAQPTLPPTEASSLGAPHRSRDAEKVVGGRVCGAEIVGYGASSGSGSGSGGGCSSVSSTSGGTSRVVGVVVVR